jgi:ribosomal protein L37E
MFLIAGVTPKIKVIDDIPKRCPVCGLYQAYYKRVDHYFNLFFIPILRVRKGKPFIMCEKCERTAQEVKEDYGESCPDITEATCRHCGKKLEKTFEYCPYCGKPT